MTRPDVSMLRDVAGRALTKVEKLELEITRLKIELAESGCSHCREEAELGPPTAFTKDGAPLYGEPREEQR